MTQAIKMNIKNLYIILLIILCSCSKSNNVEIGNQDTVFNKNVLKEVPTLLKVQTFKGAKIIVSNSQIKEYSEEQAQEILKNLKIIESSDSIEIQGFCKFKIFKEFYNSNQTNYNTESLIVNEYGVSKDEAISISNFDGTNNGCGQPFSKLIKSKNEIIYFDKGYFFSFKEYKNQTNENYKINKISGVVGDTRQEWKISYLYSGNLGMAYEDFLIRFPFGSMKFDKGIVLKNHFDKINDIEYTYQSSNFLEISKNISVGTIHIEFKSKSQNLTEVVYYLSFPIENSDYDG